MPRIYLALEVDFDDDEKVARLARYAKAGEARALRDLLVGMWRYCKRERSDGHVPIEVVGKLVYPDSPRVGKRDADRLVEVGLAEPTADGYYLPGYLKRNKSRAQLEAEAAVKAEAGRKGGQRSGEVRKVEAQSQAENEADSSSVLGISEATHIDTHNDNDKKGSQVGGQRPETLPAPAEAKPPPTTRPHDRYRCTAHQGVAEPPPCNGCKAARERTDAETQIADDRERDRRQRELEAARNACTECDGTWLTDADGKPTGKRCTHPKARKSA